MSVHFVWEDTTPTLDEIEEGGPDQYAWVRDLQRVMHGDGTAMRMSM